MKTQDERRCHKRFKAHEGAFAVHKDHSDKRKLGKILDISAGGLSFRYSTGKVGERAIFDLDILLVDGSFSLKGLPAKIISDFVLEDESTRTKMRRRGVKFEGLVDIQKSQLEHFIQNHASDAI
ncbi:MAG: PilZ domain-containing protein [Deltaproteobacteria bacterium]|nr:PilZ domain-containing protein [Deltaproteobacteria bacterium]